MRSGSACSVRPAAVLQAMCRLRERHSDRPNYAGELRQQAIASVLDARLTANGERPQAGGPTQGRSCLPHSAFSERSE